MSACAGCGATNPAGNRFCGQCGRPFAATAGDEGERRQLTVVFCDLVDSTPLADHLDPEDVREVLLAVHRIVGEHVEAQGGHVARYQGDGALAYFGWPAAAADDGARAVTASLAILADVHALTARFGTSLEGRAGVHTGLVVVGGMGWGRRAEPSDIVGDTPNIAARIQALAEPGQVLVSEATARLLGGAFSAELLGPRSLKGIEQPVVVHRVLSARSEHDRLHALASERLAPVLGRDDALAAIAARLDATAAGTAVRPLALVGDAGQGKTRLAAEVVRRVRDDHPASLLVARCHPHTSTSALHPFASVIDLSHPLGDGRAADRLADPMSDEQRRARRDALVRHLRDVAAREGLVCVLEDLHWADPATLEVLTELAEPAPGLFVLVTGRTEPGIDGIDVEVLGPLPSATAAAVLDAVSGDARVPNSVRNRLVEAAGGVPLYLEELTRAVLEESAGPDATRVDVEAGVHVPASLRDSLMGRLDRLGDAKATAQRCAVAGPEASVADLRVVADVDDDELARHLDALVGAGILVRWGPADEPRVAFASALVHETAYESVLRSVRRELHGRLVAELDRRRAAGIAVLPEVVAHHSSAAGDSRRAVLEWRRAARRAVRRSDFPEALAHCRAGLSHLEAIDDDAERRRLELDLLVTRASALQLLVQGSSEIAETADRALVLADELGDDAAGLTLRFILAVVLQADADHRRSGEIAAEAVAIAERPDNEWFLPFALQLHASSLVWRGRLDEGAAELEAAIDLLGTPIADNPEQVSAVCALYALAGLSAWLRDDAGKADRLLTAAIDLAQDKSTPQALCLARCTAAIRHQLDGDEAAVLALAGPTVELAARIGNDSWFAWATALEAWAAHVGGGPDALAALERAVDRAGPQLHSYFCALHADRLLADGEVERACDRIDEALEHAERTGERWAEPELRRLRAVALVAGGQAGADDDLALAIALATRSGTPALARKARATAAALGLQLVTDAAGREDGDA